MVKKSKTNFWLWTIIITLGLYVFREVIGWINKIIPFMNELYFFLLCVGTAMYIANKIR